MSVFTLPTTTGAPVVPVTIGFGRAAAAERRNKGLAVPLPVRVHALVDTGSDTTVLDPSVLRPFVSVGMEYVRIVVVNAPGLGGIGYYCEYAIEFRVLHPSGKPRSDLVPPDFPVVERPLNGSGFEVLIGRDLLKDCLFTLDGPANKFSFGY